MSRPNVVDQTKWAQPAKVLIVDSDARSVHELAVALRGEGYVAFEATSFAEAKRIWASELTEFLVADVRLGQFNGLQLLMQARDDRPDLTAVITCALADAVLEAEARRFGALFLVKPLEPRQILAAIGSSSRNGPAAAQVAPFPDRRREERRRVTSQTLEFERRVRERRSEQTFATRRGEDRRQGVILSFSPERRTGDRRANAVRMSTA